MNAVIYDFREFQTVRDSLRATGLSPAPLFAKLRAAQRQGDRGLSVVAAAQKMKRQFRDEFTGGDAA
ncbi:hypothetical protein [Stenotrophomonas sp.]|uniref:hypothetical protein n=1 Tax=Stenotrophomonas sp. TaxID=69392 RepID=UPI0028AA6CBE|nr:hypothetical protein [Stenotrophomonas sp.]